MTYLIEAIIEHWEGIVGVFMGALTTIAAIRATAAKKRKEAERKPLATIVPPGTTMMLLVGTMIVVHAIAIGAAGCGLLGSSEPTVRALTPVLVQVAEHVANKGMELAELPAQCEWEQDVDDPDVLLVLCTVDTGKR